MLGRLVITAKSAPVAKSSKFSFSTRVTPSSVVYNSFGEPKSVLSLKPFTVPSSIKDNDVLVEMHTSCISQGDLSVIKGDFVDSLKAHQPPAVAGSEGAGYVSKVGSKVKNLKVGDLVVPTAPSLGTWSTHIVSNENNFVSINKQIVPTTAAMIASPLTAQLLLKNFVDLKPGDVIIQNAGNGSVGLAVCQLASQMGVKTINIIRYKEDYPEAVERMKSLGAFIVCPPEYVTSHLFRKLIADLPKPRLALNAVGGAMATEMARVLAPGGTMVTYSGASRKPVQIPSSCFLLNDITLRGFFLPRWLEQTPVKERNEAIVAAGDSIRGVETFGTYFYLPDFQRAIDSFHDHSRHHRVLLSMDK